MFTDLVPVKSERDERPSETENRRCTSLYGKHADAKPFGNKKVFRREGDALGGLQQSGGGGKEPANKLSLRSWACCCEEMPVVIAGGAWICSRRHQQSSRLIRRAGRCSSSGLRKAQHSI